MTEDWSNTSATTAGSRSTDPETPVREINAAEIGAAVSELVQQACYDLGRDVEQALEDAIEKEASTIGRDILRQLLDNARLARTDRIPLCQDTGFTVVFIELGQDAAIGGGNLDEAVNDGVRRGYTEGYLRKSIVTDPFRRENTGDNTPAVIHVTIVPGEKLHLTVMAKGGGCENVSVATVLSPGAGTDGVRDFIVGHVADSGANACPPLILGIGVGGTIEKAATLAKHALLRPVGDPNPDPALAELERSIVERCNATGIGPMGLGGTVTVLAAHVLTYPCHIASLPVALNVQCHSHRHRSCVL